MKKIFASRLGVIVLSLVGLAVLVLLSSSLGSLHFREPVPFYFHSFADPGQPGIISSGSDVPIWKILSFAGLLFLILVVVMFFLDPDLRMRILRGLLQFGVVVLFIWFFFTYVYQPGSFKQVTNPFAASNAGALAIPAEGTPPVYTPPQLSPWLVFAVSFGIGLVVVFLVWVAYTRRHNLSSNLSSEVADIAVDALHDLDSDRSLDDAIVRAYVRMNEVALSERGLSRAPALTPTEFAARMERMGLPGEAVRTLTFLFEGVRYGAKVSSPADRELATVALSAIARACGREV